MNPSSHPAIASNPGTSLNTTVRAGLAGLLCGVLGLLLQPNSAFAIGGKLGSPQIAYRSDIGADSKEKIDTLYQHMRTELKFLKGSWINEYSNQSFGGNSKQVLKFLQLLDDVGLWTIHVGFRDFGEQQTAFSFHQNSSLGYISITINSAREDFSLREFRKFIPSPGVSELDLLSQPPVKP